MRKTISFFFKKLFKFIVSIIGKKNIEQIMNRLFVLFISHIRKDVLIEVFDHIYSINQDAKYERYRKQYEISETFNFNGANIVFYGSGEIICGEYSYIGSLSTIQTSSGCKVRIGNNVQISHNVRIYTLSNIADQNFNTTKKKTYKKDVIIEDYVWIGANVFINPGVTIGTNSVIGANAVITKDVLPFTIVGGVPARLIKQKTTPPTEVV